MTDCCVVCLSLCACWEVCSLWYWTCFCVQIMNVDKRLEWNSMRANKVTWIKHITMRRRCCSDLHVPCVTHFRSSHHHVSSWFHWRLKSCLVLLTFVSYWRLYTLINVLLHHHIAPWPRTSLLIHLSPSVARYVNWKETTCGASLWFSLKRRGFKFFI